MYEEKVGKLTGLLGTVCVQGGGLLGEQRIFSVSLCLPVRLPNVANRYAGKYRRAAAIKKDILLALIASSPPHLLVPQISPYCPCCTYLDLDPSCVGTDRQVGWCIHLLLLRRLVDLVDESAGVGCPLLLLLVIAVEPGQGEGNTLFG